MTAFISSHRDTEVNRVALAKVKEDKEREVQDGFDGSWVRIMTLCRFVVKFSVVTLNKAVLTESICCERTFKSHLI